MSSCLTLLDKALQIGALELDALRETDVDRADACFEERSALIAQALEQHDAPEQALAERLSTLQELEKVLYAEAQKLKDQLQSTLSDSRKQTQRMRGYGLAVRQAQQLP